MKKLHSPASTHQRKQFLPAEAISKPNSLQLMAISRIIHNEKSEFPLFAI